MAEGRTLRGRPLSRRPTPLSRRFEPRVGQVDEPRRLDRNESRVGRLLGAAALDHDDRACL